MREIQVTELEVKQIVGTRKRSKLK